MPTGHYERQQRVERETRACCLCGRSRTMLPSQWRQRSGRACGASCASKLAKAPQVVAHTKCANCGAFLTKRADHLREKNYCSRQCFADGRRVDGARWRDPETIRTYMRAYSQKNPHKKLEAQRRRRAVGGMIKHDEWIALCEQFEGRCLCCGERKKLELDHVVPVSRGGLNVISNAQPLCKSCNASKGTKTIDFRAPTSQRCESGREIHRGKVVA